MGAGWHVFTIFLGVGAVEVEFGGMLTGLARDAEGGGVARRGARGKQGGVRMAVRRRRGSIVVD